MPTMKPTATEPMARPSGFSCATLDGAAGLVLDLLAVRACVADAIARADDLGLQRLLSSRFLSGSVLLRRAHLTSAL